MIIIIIKTSLLAPLPSIRMCYIENKILMEMIHNGE